MQSSKRYPTMYNCFSCWEVQLKLIPRIRVSTAFGQIRIPSAPGQIKVLQSTLLSATAACMVKFSKCPRRGPTISVVL